MLKLLINKNGQPRTIYLNSNHCFSQPEINLANKETICPICLDDSDQEQNYLMLSCNHYFHSGCIIKWLSEDDTRGCPMCRSDQKMGDFKSRDDCLWLDEAFHSVTRKTEEFDNHPLCVICRNVFEDDLWLQLECKHIWHHGCFRRWIATRNVCPLDNRIPIYPRVLDPKNDDNYSSNTNK